MFQAWETEIPIQGSAELLNVIRVNQDFTLKTNTYRQTLTHTDALTHFINPDKLTPLSYIGILLSLNTKTTHKDRKTNKTPLQTSSTNHIFTFSHFSPSLFI
jgi:hypothetical protein